MIFRKKKVSPIDMINARKRMLSAIPIHTPAVNSKILDDGRVAFTVPRRNSLLSRIIMSLLAIPREKEVILDEIGTFVWSLCNGRNSVADIARHLQEKYKLTRKEAQVSVLQFIQTLMKKGILSVKIIAEEK